MSCPNCCEHKKIKLNDSKLPECEECKKVWEEVKYHFFGDGHVYGRIFSIPTCENLSRRWIVPRDPWNPTEPCR